MTENEKLTDRFVKLAAAPDESRPYRIYYDHEVKGFGLRVTKAGFRAFILNYRARGVERRYTIGSFPDWKVSAAREEALDKLGDDVDAIAGQSVRRSAR